MIASTSLILSMTVLVLLLGSIRGDQNLIHYFKLKQSREILQKAVLELEQETSELKKEISRIQNSPNYARKILREKYHVTEKNERIIFFAD